MDPDKTLTEILELVNEQLAGGGLRHSEIDTLANRVEDLHEWLKKGGSLPLVWEMNR